MAAESPPAYLQDSSHGAALFRQALTSLFGLSQPGTLAASDGGVTNVGDLDVTQNGTPNMSVNVAGGSCWIPQTNAANGGLYFGLNDGTVNLAISAADLTDPRIDTVVATVNDAAYSGATNNWVLQVLTGTPTSGATLSNLSGKAALTESSIVLGYVLVPADASTIVTADIDNVQTPVSLLSPLRGVLIGEEGALTSATPPPATTGAYYLQCGTLEGETNGAGGLTVSFPVPFENGVAAVLVTSVANAPEGAGGALYANVYAPDVSASGFDFTTFNASGIVASTIVGATWIAIGY